MRSNSFADVSKPTFYLVPNLSIFLFDWSYKMEIDHESKGEFVQEESYTEIARERTPSIAQALEKVIKEESLIRSAICK